MSEQKGVIFNIQRYSIDDGPGIRTIVFLKGCPLRCLWCCNPESQNLKPEISHNSNLCVKCGRCAIRCPNKAITMTENGPVINREICVSCGTCTEECYPQAIKLIGEEKTVSEIYRIVKKDEMFYRASGGGLTVSGGEPLMQVDFVEELFRLCRADRIPTAVETCGMVPRSSFEKILPLTDLFLYDIKQMDDEKHRKLTAVSNRQILSNLSWLVRHGANVLVRLPLIPGLNDSDEDMKAVAEYVQSLGLKRVELMPYHDYGSGKYSQLDREYELSELKRHEEQRVVDIHNIFENMGIKCDYIK